MVLAMAAEIEGKHDEEKHREDDQLGNGDGIHEFKG
jgi:hypothetical protein